MLRRMKVAMLLADAASVADGNLDILGGEEHRATRMARPGLCRPPGWCRAEARLAQPRVPLEGIAAKRWGGA